MTLSSVYSQIPSAAQRWRLLTLGVLTVFSFTLISPVAVLAAEDNIATTDNSPTVNTNEVAEALRGTEGILSGSDQTPVSSDTDSAIKAATAGATIDVPKDASEGVTLDGEGVPALEISLPNADQATDAKQVAPGTVAYGGSNGSANAVQATEDGGVRMLTIIDNPNAPTTYDYNITIPEGGRVELNELGGASIVSNADELIAVVASPWAKDANGTAIKTYFTTDGTRLIQHIEHNVPGVVYPVTADPWFLAALVAAAQVAAIACAANAAQSFIWQGAQWAIRRGDWNWTQKAIDAANNCAQGAVFGWAGRFIPAAYKAYVYNSIRGIIVNHLLWLVRR